MKKNSLLIILLLLSSLTNPLFCDIALEKRDQEHLEPTKPQNVIHNQGIQTLSERVAITITLGFAVFIIYNCIKYPYKDYEREWSKLDLSNLPPGWSIEN